MKPLLLAPLFAGIAFGVDFDDCYKVETIKLPDGVPPEVGAIDFASDGTLFVALRRGDIIRAKPSSDPNGFKWELFATGFQNGCGLDVVSPVKVRVIQMSDMTEAEDTDGDGKADSYMRFSSGWGLSGNYHETNSLTRDGKGGYYFSLGTASHAGPVFTHVLNDFSAAGHRGRNFSSVKWRGWVMHCDDKGVITPFASGFRMANGIYRDPDGNVWCGDNQGDWKAVTPLYLVEKGNFYGHPSSLNWDPAWAGKDPLQTYRDDLGAYNKARTKATVELPNKTINRSAGEPMELPRAGGFGPFAGQLLVPDNNSTRISRVMLEKVNGRFQGSVTHFIKDHGLRSGNHRLRFTADGKQLYVGATVRGWGTPAEGLQRITWLGGTPFDVNMIHVTKTGFKLEFTKDIPDDLLKDKWKVSSFTYQPKWTYGSDEDDKKSHEISSITRTGKNSLEVKVADFSAARIYQLDLPKAESADHSQLQNRLFYYTANQLP
ncbi:hypothetical protein KBB96_12710 [Luteolibacter ambystomatis]|uniref:DUF7133 domain-containing protein n=1 Tax=Luteolibacter ambystomatis TaxID=2824561 RepID=A0A975G6L4_9BACT|nr:hypothetical protein [Luteolibacter ambystomatis]QUE49731.1 hypothetical protein KBB96_12710 [Luteolibacter ambystomatis]